MLAYHNDENIKIKVLAKLQAHHDADEFVTKYRGPLEKYFEKPARKSVLVLNVKTWAKTTRLAKQVAASIESVLSSRK